MRTLILLRGCPGVGKSTWIKENNLQEYTLEPDAIRLMFQAPQLNVEGKQQISQKNDKKVWETLFDFLENRMARGDLTVIDATHSRTQQINKYKKLATIYRYRVYIVDFSNIDLETILQQNKQRDKIKQVPEEVIETIYQRLQTDKPPSWVTKLKPEFAMDELKYTPYSADQYDSIHIVGDIHGCYDALTKTLEEVNKNTLYIFLGDYLDRGVQNKETFDYLYSLKDLPNTVFLEGNHERHWRNYLKDPTIKLPRYTAKAFEELGKSKEKIKSFYQKLTQAFYFTFNSQTYIATHGGISNKPSIKISTDDYVFGVGKYSEDKLVDEAFTKNCPNIVSIRGHRNMAKTNFQSTENVINLCGTPEFGGELRSIVLKKKESLEFRSVIQSIYNENLIPVQDTPKPKLEISTSANTILKEFVENKYVNVKSIKKDVVVINFSKKAFYKNIWNNITCKARGLYLTTEGDVIARAYDKFFNYGQVEEAKGRNIQNLKFPLTVYQKENGFLGILSVYKGEWFIACKSTIEGKFPDMFKELVIPKLTLELKKYIETNSVSLVFEVNHLNDPHIVKYSNSHLILLDIIKNTHSFNKLPFEELQIVGEELGFTVKCQTTILQTFEEWRVFRDRTKAESQFNPTIEGWVIEDAEGFNFKLKSQFYSFWKYMRTLKDKLYKTREQQYPEIAARLHSKDDFTVFKHLTKLPKEDLKKNIIEIYEEILPKLAKE